MSRIASYAGAGVLMLEEPSDGWPGFGQINAGVQTYPVALYAGRVGLSHRDRDQIERRFQNPGGHRAIRDERPDRTALLLGLWEGDELLDAARPVIVVADPIRRMHRETRFSVFAGVEPLTTAARTGWAEAESADGERLTYLWPELLGVRFADLPQARGRPRVPFGQPLRTPRVRPRRPVSRDPFPTDPDLVDRGTQAHYDVEEALRAWVESRGATPVGPVGAEPLYDLGWTANGTSWIAEVKSVTAANEERQLRYGLGQILDYGTALAHLDPRLVLVAEREPSDLGGKGSAGQLAWR